jgi:hypothetical protein
VPAAEEENYWLVSLHSAPSMLVSVRDGCSSIYRPCSTKWPLQESLESVQDGGTCASSPIIRQVHSREDSDYAALLSFTGTGG